MTRHQPSAMDVAVAVNRIELAIRCIAIISQARPELSRMLDDAGLGRNLSEAMDRLTKAAA